MTIQECYQQFGGNFDEVKKRLPSEALIKKFIAKFLDDHSFSDLQTAMDEGNREDAFRAAHTLKGVCGNLNLDKLLSAASQLTEFLRPETAEIPEGADVLFEEVKQDYELTVSAIRAYLDSEDKQEGELNETEENFKSAACVRDVRADDDRLRGANRRK